MAVALMSVSDVSLSACVASVRAQSRKDFALQYDQAGNLIPEPEPQGVTLTQEQFDAMKAAAEEGPRAARRAALLEVVPADKLNSPLGQMFGDGYKGDLTPDAIRVQALAVGLLTEGGEQPPAATFTPDPVDLAAQQVRDGATANGVIPPATPEEIAAMENPSEAGFKAFHERIAQGASREEASAEWFNRQVVAAINGDERAIAKRVQVA